MWEIIVWVTVFVAWLTVLTWMFALTFDHGALPGVAAAVLLILGISVLVWGAEKQDEAQERIGPCLRYETGYVSTGKTVVPYRHCVERGEWIKQ
jgi:hypothetical protein